MWETIYERASCLIRISGPLALPHLPCLPTSQQNCVGSTRKVGIHTSKSSFLLSDSAAEGTTSIVSNLLLGNRQSRSFNYTLSFLFSPLFPSFLDHADSISSILNVSFIYCPVLSFRSACAYSGSQPNSRTSQALIRLRDGYCVCDCDCDWYSLLHLIPPTSYLNQVPC